MFYLSFFFFFFFKQKTAYEIMPSLVGSEMCIRDSIGKIVTKTQLMNTAAVTSHPTRGASCHSPQATTATAATIPTTAERAARVRTGMNRGAPVGSGRMLVMIPVSYTHLTLPTIYSV